MYDTTLTGRRQRVVADYIVHCGLASAALRDEIFLQLVNLTFQQLRTAAGGGGGGDGSAVQRTWQLMAHCLSCFRPSDSLHNYLLKSVAASARALNTRRYCENG